MSNDGSETSRVPGDGSVEPTAQASRHASADYQAALGLLLEEHAQWLRTNGREGTRLDLSQQDLTNAGMEYVKLDGAQLTGSSFASARFAQCDFREANLSKSKFTEAQLLRADFSSARFADAEFPKE